MEIHKKGIAVAGSLIADVVYTLDTYPKEGLLANICDTKYNVGGCGNLILDLAQIDPQLPVRVSAVIGADSLGQMLWDKLSCYKNIQLHNITREGASSITYVMNPQDTKQRTFFFQPGASDIFDAGYIDWEGIQSEIFVLEYLLLMKKVDAPDAEYGTHGAGILHRAQQLGMKTAIDVVSAQNSRAKTVVIPALKYVNFCIINELEAGAVTDLYIDGARQEDAETVRPVLEKIAGMGVADWVIIHTVAASYGYDCQKREVVVVPGLQLPKGYIKGNTGAGDAFFGGVLYGAYTHMELKKALQFATAAAVCSLSEENGTDGMRAAAEIWETDERLRTCDKLT